MLKFYQRFGFSCTIILFCCLLVLVGCSSKKPVPDPSPRYLSGLPDTYKDDVKVDPAKIRYRIILLGDGGEPMENEPVLKTLGEWAKKLPEKTSVVFLGDNIYPDGLTEDNWDQDVKRLNAQLDIVIESQARGMFIPGNHDWASGRKSGLSHIIMQADFINKKLGAQAGGQHPAFLPECGKPGPSVLELPIAAPVVRLVVLDTQWWLHEHQKPYNDHKEVIADLKTRLMTELPVIVVGHHPIETYGPHGGDREWWKSVGCFFSRLFGCNACNQDVKDKPYAQMVKQLEEAFSVAGKTSLLIYAAGHDHSLQVLKGSTADYLLVSGAASCWKLSKVELGANALFAYKHTGFMVVDFLESGKVLLRVVQDGDKEVQLSYPLNYSLKD